MKILIMTIVISLAVLGGCDQLNDTQTDVQINHSGYRCQSFGGFSEDVCMASIFRLAAHPDLYEGKIIGVNGYIQVVDGDYYIFASKDFFNAKDFSNSLICDPSAIKSCEILASYVGQNVSVFGFFSDQVIIGEWTLRPIGLIKIDKVIAR